MHRDSPSRDGVTETDEHRDLRAAVASRFGPRYYAERSAAHEPCSEPRPAPAAPSRAVQLADIEQRAGLLRPADGELAELHVAAGDQVATGQVLAVVTGTRGSGSGQD